MSADFNAGSIEGTLDLNVTPFRRGLEWAKAEAQKFQRNPIKPNLDLDTTRFTQKKDEAEADLALLGEQTATPNVELNGFDSTLAKLKVIQHEIDKTTHAQEAQTAASAASSGAAGLSGMAAFLPIFAQFALMPAGILAIVAALGPLTAAVIAFGTAAAVAFGGVALSLGLFALAVKSAMGPIMAANKAGKTLTGWAGRAQSAFGLLTGAWKDLMHAVKPEVYQALATVFSDVAGVLPKLAPLIKIVANGVGSLAMTVLALTKTPMFAKFLRELATFMGGFLKGLAPALVLALKIFMHLFGAVQPLLKDMGKWILKALTDVDKFANHLQHGGMDKFVSGFAKYLPLYGKLISDIFSTIGKLGSALAPLAGPAIKFVDALVRGLGNLDLKPLVAGIANVLGVLVKLGPTIGPVLNFLLTTLGAILSWLTPGRLLAIAAAITTMFAAFQVMKWISAIKEATGAFATLDAVMDANVIGVVVLAIAALAAAFIYAYTHVTWFRNAVNDVWSWVKDHWPLLLPIFLGPIGALIDIIIKFHSQIIGAFKAVWDWIKGPFVNFWIGLPGDIGRPLDAAWGWVKRAWGDITGAFSDAWDWVEHTFSALWHGVENYIVNPVKDAYNTLKGVWGDIKGGFSDAISAIGHFFSGLPGKLEAPIKSALSWISDHFISPINSLLGKVGLSLRLPTFGGGGSVGPNDFMHGGGTQGPGGRYASGGMLRGPWKGATADNLVIRANPREFIEPVSSVNYYGPGLFEALRRRLIPKEALPGYSVGGIIGDIGHGFSTAWHGVTGAAGKVISALNPAHIFTMLADRLLHGFADNPFGQVVGAVAKQTIPALASKVADFVGGLFSGKSKLSRQLAAMGPGAYKGSYGVGEWAGIASRVLAMLGQSQSWLPTLLHRMMVESGGNPRAINLWDSNAAAGHPSKGLMQVIDPTFNEYAGPMKHLGIWNPLANIYAAVRYALARYGVPAVGGTQGYAAGGITNGPLHALIGDNPGGHEAVVPLDKYDLPRKGDLDTLASRSTADNAQIIALLKLIAAKSGVDTEGLAEALGNALTLHSKATMRQVVQIARAA